MPTPRPDAVLIRTAQQMMTPGKGLIAMDESMPTCDKRFKACGIPTTALMRQKYRELIVTTAGLGEAISGAILFDETIRQTTTDGRPMAKVLEAQGIIPGIKVDGGAKDMAAFPGEKITEGLDGLAERLAEYRSMGARFAKWRAVITIGDGLPTDANIAANAHALARYAGLCQAAGIVPIVEPEVLMDGSHDLEQCAAVTARTQRCVFDVLIAQRVLLEGMILKPNMVLPGLQCSAQASADEVADATMTCLLRNVPAAVGGVAFLSGGQPAIEASERLNAMNAKYAGKLPWPVTFSYSRAIQQPALEIWKGHDQNVAAAQAALLHRARSNSAARRGEYSAAVENAA